MQWNEQTNNFNVNGMAYGISNNIIEQYQLNKTTSHTPNKHASNETKERQRIISNCCYCFNWCAGAGATAASTAVRIKLLWKSEE